MSPYPSLKDVNVRPTLACTPYVEARIVLEGVHNKRNNLEANLDTILRSHYVLPSYDITTPGVNYRYYVSQSPRWQLLWSFFTVIGMGFLN